MRILSLLSLSAFLLTCCGCGGGGNVPAELRNLVPASVTVMNGTQPMMDVQVILLAKAGQGAYACTGITGNDGVATIQSSRGSYTGNGVPEGTYSVVLSKSIDVPDDLVAQESDQNLPPAAQAEKSRKLDEFLNKNRVVPVVLSSAGTSPIELVIAKGQDATVSIDVAKHR